MREIKHVSVHQWLRSAIPDSQQPTSPIGFLFLKLPPPPCAVLLVVEGSLEVKLPTIWTDEKQSREEAEKRERLEERRSEEKESEDRRCRCAKR